MCRRHYYSCRISGKCLLRSLSEELNSKNPREDYSTEAVTQRSERREIEREMGRKGENNSMRRKHEAATGLRCFAHERVFTDCTSQIQEGPCLGGSPISQCARRQRDKQSQYLLYWVKSWVEFAHQRLVHGPAALALPGRLTEIQNCRPHPHLLNRNLYVNGMPQVIHVCF